MVLLLIGNYKQTNETHQQKSMLQKSDTKKNTPPMQNKPLQYKRTKEKKNPLIS